ncbi:sigma-54-dependent Fis family transcriptional regulator [Rhodococcus sp. NPDC058521]|uniref:sigma-54-dependent Fis family transcriptional regulator n=1 Tax=Rhodococcus sp. NPDC058521 TaxID=3346536 RepID=UPI00365198F8
MPADLPVDVIRGAREEFLDGRDALPDVVRAPVLDSWKRSKSWNVDSQNLEFPFVREPNLETVLGRAAAPVTRELAEDLSGEPVALVLSAADGVVLDRSSADSALTQAFDTYGILRGHSCAEEHVGTNAIGTALEARATVLVDGHEHYADPLVAMSCVGVPIVHPISGTLLGALDLTWWAGGTRSLLASLAKSTVRHIESRILDGSGVRERHLFEAYRRTCRRTTKGVLAIGGDVLLVNDYVRKILDNDDQTVLVGHAVDLLVASIVQPLTVSLPSGRSVRITPVDAGTAGRGTVVFTVAASESKPVHDLSAARPKLPGVVGASTSWQRSCAEVVRRVRAKRWVLVEGETGVGRSHLLRIAAAENLPGGRPKVLGVLDYTDQESFLGDVASELEVDDFRLVLRDLDALDPSVALDLLRLLEKRRQDGWVGASMNTAPTGESSALREAFDRVVPVTPLRHRVGDLEQLVPHLLGRMSTGSGPMLSPDAAAQLARYAWPGNVAQLRRILAEVVQKQRSGVVAVDKLPAECRAVTRRRLTQIESLQRDAIVQSLHDNSGDKTAAAAALGISRATIYRRIREFGIT